MSRTVRAVPYLAIGVLIVWLAVWFGQDLFGTWIIGSFAAVGLFLAWRRPREVVGWLLVAFAIGFATVGSVIPGPSTQVVDGHAGVMITLVAWVSSWGVAGVFGSLVGLAVLFPSGRFPSGRVGMVGRVAIGLPLAFMVALAFAPAATVSFSDGVAVEVQLPLAVAPGWAGWAAMSVAGIAAVLASLALGIGTLVARFRAACGPEREQYKWFLAALAATAGTVLFAFSMLLLVNQDGTWMWWPAVFAYPLIPISIGIAVTRYRLYEIDRVVSRTVAYLLVTGLLVAVFAGAVIGLQAALGLFVQGQTLAVAGSTLVAAALFQPLRRRVQRLVDRRFDRTRYDAQLTADRFAERIRDRSDLPAVEADLVGTAARVMRPSSTGLWLRSPGP